MSHRSVGENIEIQPRDVELLSTLFECRVLTRSQAAVLHFGGRTEATKKRLQALVRAAYVKALPNRLRGRSVFTLSRRGYELLRGRAHPAVDGYHTWIDAGRELRVSPSFVDHEIDVTDVRAAIVTAVAAHPGLRLTEICTRSARIAFDAQEAGNRARVEPDGFFRLGECVTDGADVDHYFFLEVDRSTESCAVLVRKAACYRGHYRHGGLAARYGGRPERFKAFPFRVLVTCRTPERRNNLAARLLTLTPKPGGQVWLTTFAEAIANPLDAIWVTPSAYAAAVAGTVYAPPCEADAPPRPCYRRDAKRDRWVEHHVIKRRLLSGARPTSRANQHHQDV